MGQPARGPGVAKGYFARSDNAIKKQIPNPKFLFETRVLESFRPDHPVLRRDRDSNPGDGYPPTD